MKRACRNLLAILMALQLAACAVMGPSTISSSRPGYNTAVQRSNDQEMLLNLVRILYRDTTYFTSVERIAASYEFSSGIKGGLSWTNSADALSRSMNLGDGSMGYTESPTVVYAPIEGEKFVRQMLTPMNPNLLLLLVKSGWSLDRVFSIGVQQMNGLRNAPSASGTTPDIEPEFKEFKEVLRLMRTLQKNTNIDLEKSQSGEGIDLRFENTPTFAAEIARIKKLLRLDPLRDSFEIRVGAGKNSPDKIYLSARPLIAAMTYLSQGIQAPQADIEAGKVRKTMRLDGHGVFDWQDLLEGVFCVNASLVAPPPEQVSVMVRYRGSYFYIADNDLDSKSTFVLLNQLMALNATPPGQSSALNFTFGK